MSNHIIRFLRHLSFGLLFFICACSVNKSISPRYYILSPLHDKNHDKNVNTSDLLIKIGIVPVEIPAYLDRPQIVTSPRENEIILQEFYKWGEPLIEGITRVLSENLTNLLSTEPISVFVWKGSRSSDYQIIIDISRFDGELGGDVTLIASWTIRDEKKDQNILAVRSRFVEQTGSPNYDAFVAAQSRAIEGLSQRISEAIIYLIKERK